MFSNYDWNIIATAVMEMYYNTEDKTQFLKSELRALRNARGSAVKSSTFIEQTWDREEANLTRHAMAGEDHRSSPAYAARERFRHSHIEATKLKDEVAGLEYDLGIDDDEYGDLDEYGYAA